MSGEYDIIGEFGYDHLLRIMHSIPSCIFFKDTDLRYVFSTQHWEQLNTDNVIGKTDLEIRKDTENAKLAMDADRNILETGKGCRYTIKSDIDGHVQYLELIKEPVFDDIGKPIGIVGLINDITDKVIAEQKLKDLSTKDGLTKLYNRRAGVELIEERLKNYKESIRDIQSGDIPMYFMLLDLNKFKHINDTYGHQTGDILLKKTASVIRSNCTDNCIALRLGGDEFIIFVSGMSERILKDYINKLVSEIDAIRLINVFDKISVSIGVTKVRKDSTFDTLYYSADQMMYKAKKSGAEYLLEEDAFVEDAAL